MSNRWLRCRIFRGMFSDELAIQYPPEGGAPAYFVPRETVRGEHDGIGSVSVRVYCAGPTHWAVLPTEHQQAVRIQEGDLLGA